MLCDKCKKNTATYHSRTIINGIESSEHLCSECAAKMGKKIESPSFGLFDVFSSPFIDDRDFGFDLIPENIWENENFLPERKENNGIIDNALSSIKKGADKFNKDKSNIDPEVEKLKLELKDAVEKEDYEKAAVLKKKIEEKTKNNEDKKGE